MGYVAGETILDDEYVNFLNGTDPAGINHIMGTGTGNQGLGQTGIGAVVAGDTITAAQWNALFTAMTNIANHVNRSITSNVARAAGQDVAVVSAIVTDLANIASDVAGGSVNATDGLTAGSEDLSLVANKVYDKAHVTEASFTFAGGDETRFFFNAGGKLRVLFTNTATGSTGRDTALSAVISALGNFDMGATVSTRSGSGETLTTNGLALGYYDATTSYQTIITLTEDSGDYSGDIAVKVEFKRNAAHGDGRGNNGSVITVKCSLLQNETTRDDYTSGNLSSVIVEEEAVGPTDFSFRTIDPTTAQGLSTVYNTVNVAQVSNAIVNAD